MTDQEQVSVELVVDVVLLRRIGTTVVPMVGSTAVDFSTDVPSKELLAELLDSATSLSAPLDVVRALLLEPVPALFAGTPWLWKHRALTFTDTGESIGARNLRYHTEFGVYAEEDA